MKKLYAFTFIEIMIAIVIFSVGILAVLSLVTSNLRSMDKNNLKLQATLLAKEGIELVYNIRDSNLQKELNWNCLINKNMYTRTTEQLSTKIGWGNQSDFEKVICDGYFGTGKLLKISFDPNTYVYYDTSAIDEDFFERYTKNKLYLYSETVNGQNIFWYGHDSNTYSGENTNFARYIKFKPVKEGENYLPLEKIMKIESHVLYVRGATTGEVIFESFIGNY